MTTNIKSVLQNYLEPNAKLSLPPKVEKLIAQKRYAKAITALENSGVMRQPLFGVWGYLYMKVGHFEQSLQFFSQSLQRAPKNLKVIEAIAYCHTQLSDDFQAAKYWELALQITPDNVAYKFELGKRLFASFYYHKAIAALADIPTTAKQYGVAQYTLGSVYNAIGCYAEAEQAFDIAKHNLPREGFMGGSYLSGPHYNPAKSADDIYHQITNWVDAYLDPQRPTLCEPQGRTQAAQKKIKIGLISEGFRVHPVGQMSTSTFEHLDPERFELVFYATQSYEDHITERLKAVASAWNKVGTLSELQLAQKIKADRIDILFDLAGHMKGTRMNTIAMKPAPLIVKWVGGLISTTGVPEVDYLLSDSIETPSDSDIYYTEKLIRLPGDYICYSPPNYSPKVSELPALTNGFITFGCFNNVTKVNAELVKEWAILLRELPSSKLFIKSAQLSSTEARDHVKSLFVAENIDTDRLIIQGPSSHAKLLACYQSVDIALDTWPYSGGLTTCEALYMGVPVVTFPGPTFAGRHSATHLVNAGMPELVTNSWVEYRQRALELAADLQSLQVIRRHLRTTVQQSPLCDVKRFTANFNVALQAIWQRHCDGKAPAALTFSADQTAQFADEDKPVSVSPVALSAPSQAIVPKRFSWSLQSRIITLSNSSELVESSLVQLPGLASAFTFLLFDPASRAHKPTSADAEHLQVFAHADLGDGEQKTLYATLDPEYVATEQALIDDPKARVLTELPIPTVALDNIEGLPQLDWLVLDHRTPAQTVLEHGAKLASQALVIHIATPEQSLYAQQLDKDWLVAWAKEHGFDVFTDDQEMGFNLSAFQWHAQPRSIATKHYLLVRNDLRQLDAEQKYKLACLFDIAYQNKVFAHLLLETLDVDVAQVFKQLELPQKAEAGSFALPTEPRMSIAEQKLFKKALKNASKYFEFGSGGSSVWAAQHDLTVYGVESDANWVHMIKEELDEKCQIDAVDIGPTGAWGYPLDYKNQASFPRYSQAIFKHDQPFDLILVDGRFRVACALASVQYVLTHHPKPRAARIFIHDFWNRLSSYATVLEYLEPVAQAESAGLFRVKSELNLEQLQQHQAEFQFIPT